MSTAHLLEVRNLKLSYGGITAVKGIDFYINSGELVTLIGANGAGMNASEKLELKELILKIRDDGKTVLLIEHDVHLVMSICDYLTVLDYGKVIADGLPNEVRRHLS